MCDQLQWENPTYSWTYGDEDLMGLLKKLANLCTAGTRSTLVVNKVIRKIFLGILSRIVYRYRQ